ncbi:MAG: hypothetical protein JEZ04_03585 [Spirochaetales bacterium]|nr:hypothetical protein [Spirochaetales bacterium]
MTQMSQALDEITSSTVELSIGGQEIVKVMVILSDISGQVSRDAHRIEENLRDMEDEMSSAQTESKVVRHAINIVYDMVSGISSSMDKVVELPGKLGETAEELNMEVHKFKT